MVVKENHYLINTDGGSRGNPGPSALGYVIKDGAGNVLELCGKYIGVKTNNEAEYAAIKAAYEKVRSLTRGREGEAQADFFIDSQLCVSQLRGIFKIKNAHLKILIEEIKSEETKFRKVSYNYVPREENFAADELVNKALDERIK